MVFLKLIVENRFNNKFANELCATLMKQIINTMKKNFFFKQFLFYRYENHCDTYVRP